MSVKFAKSGREIEVILPKISAPLKRPLFVARVNAGFPSPADDYIDQKLDLNEHLIHHPEATFFVKVIGDSMINGGIHEGDLLIVDRALVAKNGSVVIAIIYGEFTVKRYKSSNNKIFLIAENPNYPSLELNGDEDFQIWGVVTNIIHKCN